MRCALAITASLAVLCAPSLEARADGSELPAGRFGVATGLRSNLGALGDEYRFGWMALGIEAGYHPTSMDEDWSFGVNWLVMVRGYLFASQASAVESSIGLTEMSGGLRMRRKIGVNPRFLLATAGGMLSRSTDPLAPDGERSYVGPYAGLGGEVMLWPGGIVGAELRYSMFPNGPESITLMIGISAGLNR